MRALLGVAALLLSATVSPAVCADSAPRVEDLPPTALWDSLPTVALSHVPPAKSAPAALARGEHAEGVWVIRPKWMQATDYRTTASVVGSRLLAEEQVSGRTTVHDNDVCVTPVAMPALVDDVEPAKDWPSDMPSQAMVSWQPPKKEDNAWSVTHRPLRVSAVHLERLVPDGEGFASLEYRDAWVDPVTLGSRLIGKGALRLARVADGPAGLVVYAARDGDLVHFVVQPGAPPSDVPQLRAVVRNLSAQFNFGHSDCGFLRATLPSIEADVVTFTTFAITGVTLQAPPTEGPVVRPRMARRRNLLVFASATQSSADLKPVVSVAFGWGGREDEFQF